MPKKPNVLVVGSINMDLVVRTPSLPEPGETVLGDGFVTNPGGKGANQAVAAARLGANVAMVGRVGDDAFGRQLMQNLHDEGVNCESVMITQGVPSAVAMIIVDGNGENSIVVASNANWRVTPDDVFSREDQFAAADVVLLQLELPLPTVRAACQVAKRCGAKIVLDPAPAPRHLCDTLCEVDVLSPNASETERITGKRSPEDRVEKHVAMDLIARGAKAAVLKLGSRGCLVVTADEQFATIPACKVDVVDTTAAGDAFTAALAVGIAQGRSLPQAAKLANAAGALACTRLGAQAAMPTMDEVRILLADQHEE
ncbi:MAG: ribokinase [Phycisphaerae bacterium]